MFAKRYFMNNVKSAVSTAVNELRGTFIEVLGQNMSSKDKEQLYKYVIGRVEVEKPIPEVPVKETINIKPVGTPTKSETKPVAATPTVSTTYRDMSLLHPVFGNLLLN